MMNQFYSGVLLIVETSGKLVTVYQDIDTLPLEILKLIEFQILPGNVVEQRGQKQCE